MALQNLDDQVQVSSKRGGLNSGNIRSGPNSFKTYNSDEEGAQDHIRLLGVYQRKHGINTIGGVVDRWAPVSDNNHNNANYKKFIADGMGVGINDEIDLTDPETAGKFAYYQSQFEHGKKNVHHNEDWYIGQAYDRVNGNEPVQHATAAKRHPTLSNLDDQVQTSAPAAQPSSLPNIDEQVATPPAEDKGSFSYMYHHPEEIPGAFKELGKDVALGVLGTREHADWQHPLGFLSPYHDKDLTDEDIHNAQAVQQAGKEAVKVGGFILADEFTGGLLTPLAPEVLEGSMLGRLALRTGRSVAGSVGGQEAASVYSGDGLTTPDMKEVGQDVAFGEGLHLAGKVVKPISDAARGRIANRQTEVNLLRQQGANDVANYQALNMDAQAAANNIKAGKTAAASTKADIKSTQKDLDKAQQEHQDALDMATKINQDQRAPMSMRREYDAKVKAAKEKVDDLQSQLDKHNEALDKHQQLIDDAKADQEAIKAARPQAKAMADRGQQAMNAPGPDTLLQQGKEHYIVTPDVSKLPTRVSGMGEFANMVSKGGSIAEQGIPFAKTVRSLSERGLKETATHVGKEAVGSAALGGSLFSPLAHSVTIPLTKVTAPLAILKHLIDRGHIRNVKRVVEDRKLWGDTPREALYQALGHTPKNAVSVAQDDAEEGDDYYYDANGQLHILIQGDHKKGG